MNNSNVPYPEDRARDALLVAAFLHFLHEDDIAESSTESHLLPEDVEALSSLGPNLVQRLVAGEFEGKEDSSESSPSLVVEYGLCSGFYRNGADSNLSEAARKEMLERIKGLTDDD